MFVKDKLDRRNRIMPLSSGKEIHPERRDMVMFEKLHCHGPLDPVYLYEFTKHIARNYNYLRTRLGNLYHEDNTPHGGTYLLRPRQQRATVDTKMIHDNTAYAEMALKERGKFYDFHPKASPINWFHDYMLSCITASFELAAGDRYIHHHEIVGRLGGKLTFIDKKLRPDRFFGIKYDDGAIIYVLEGDMGTEPLRSNTARKTFEKNLELYKQFIGKGEYKKDFWKGARLICLTATTNKSRMHSMLDIVKDPCPYMLFTHLPEFADYYRPPAPLTRLFTEPWHRVGNEPFSIDKGV